MILIWMLKLIRNLFIFSSFASCFTSLSHTSLAVERSEEENFFISFERGRKSFSVGEVLGRI